MLFSHLHRYIYVLPMLLVVACMPSSAPGTPPAGTYDASSKANWAHEESDLAPEPGIVFGTLENGFRYVVMANDTPTGTAALRMRIDAGSYYETEDERGLSHFLEHMAFNGSAAVPEGEMIKILERLGLAFGPDTNAFTSFDQVQYQLDLPAVDEEHIETGLFLMRQTASELTLDAGAIDRERGVILSEARLRNSVGLRQYRALMSFLLPDAILADRLPIGEAEIIETAPRTRFEALYRRTYRPENTVLVVAGDIVPDDIIARIKTTFAEWSPIGPPAAKPELGAVDFARPTEAGLFVEPDAQTAISIIYPQPHVKELDTSSARRMNLLRTIGNGILNRRLARLARAEEAPFLSGGLGTTQIEGLADLHTLSLLTTPEKWRAALPVAEQELRRALQYGFSEAEVREQLANLRAGIEAAADRASTRSSTALANSLVSAVHEARVFTSPASSLERYESYESELTAAPVHAAFRAQFEGAVPQLFLSLNQEDGAAKIDLLSLFADSQTAAVTSPLAQKAVHFAYTDFGPAGEIVSDTMIEDLGIRTLRFANNVRLNLKRTDFEANTVRASVRIGGGRLELPLAPGGLALFANGALANGGLAAHSVDELRTLLAGRIVSARFSAGADSFGASAQTTPDDLLLQLQLWTAFVTAPGYRADGQAQWRKTVESIYEQLDATPQQIIGNRVARLLRDGHPHWGLPEKEVLLARTYEELAPLLARAQSDGAIEIGIVGDIDESVVIDAVARTFGALSQRRKDTLSFDQARIVRFPEARGTHILRHSGQADQALTALYWPTTDDSDNTLFATMRLLRAVLQLKLTDALRETLGATYSPSTGLLMSAIYPDYGYLSATAEVDPADLARVTEAILAVVDDAARGEISEDELQRARQPILEQIDESLENNRFWLAFIAEAQTTPENLDWLRERRAIYTSITTADIATAAKVYLQNQEPFIAHIISDKLDISSAGAE